MDGGGQVLEKLHYLETASSSIGQPLSLSGASCESASRDIDKKSPSGRIEDESSVISVNIRWGISIPFLKHHRQPMPLRLSRAARGMGVTCWLV